MSGPYADGGVRRAMMAAADVIEVLDQLDASGIRFWVDGGWGVDALLGRETRLREDLDVVVGRDDLRAVRTSLAALGFEHGTSRRRVIGRT
jgi:lincosamide nucleotidyltransferase A/C/D/E